MSGSVVASRDPRKIRRYLNFIENLSRVSWLPTLSRWHPWLRPDKTDIRWLPIDEDIEAGAGSPRPLQLLDSIIEEAPHRVILDYCACREAYSCEGYPSEIGCLRPNRRLVFSLSCSATGRGRRHLSRDLMSVPYVIVFSSQDNVA
jgi:hypothetical protein